MALREPPMDSDEHRYPHDPLSEAVIGAAYKVANSLGPGFLEKVYENALAHEIRKASLEVEQQARMTVLYDGVEVGDYIADLIIQKSLVIELKACKALEDIHVAQCLNYLKASGLHTCLLMNFGTPKIQVRRLAR